MAAAPPQCSPGASATAAAISVASALASSSDVGFIFQLPPMMLVRAPSAAARVACRGAAAGAMRATALPTSAARATTTRLTIF